MFKQRHKFYSQIDDELIVRLAYFRHNHHKLNQEIKGVIYLTKMEEKDVLKCTVFIVLVPLPLLVYFI